MVGHRVPQKVREATGGAVLLQSAVRSLFQVEQEVGRLQHALYNDLRTLHEIVSGGRVYHEELFVARDFGLDERPPECAQAELPNELLSAHGIGGRRSAARNQRLAVAAAERVARQFLRGAIVRLLLHGRDALARCLIGEAVDEVFLRELVSWPGLVAE